MLLPVIVALAAGFLGYAYQSSRPPPPKLCGSINGPPVTSPRVELKDGRHIAYREAGVPKDDAKYKIIVIHGFDSSKDVDVPIPQGLVEELGVYFLFFDRAGHGESDPNPSRTVKSEAFDIQELADKLQIGPKFYVIGMSLGAYPVYGCLKYIPHRLSGASLVVPFVNYWWTRVPGHILNEGFKNLLPQDQWAFRVAHHTPWLFYWWMTRTWIPKVSIMAGNTEIFGDCDLEVIKKWSENPIPAQEKVRQQGVHESLHRDAMTGYGKWEFDPTELSNPFPNNEGSVHIWQGLEDRIIPRKVNRYISEKLPWIRYHEVPNAGHFLIFSPENFEAILRALLLD